MVVTAAFLTVLAGAGMLPADQAARPPVEKVVAVEVGSGASRRGGLLETLLAVLDDDASTAETGLVSALHSRAWLRVVPNEGDVAVAISRCRRSQSSPSRSKDGKKVTITFRYTAVAAVAIRGERDTIESEVSVFQTYAAGTSRMVPTASEDRSAFERAGKELGPKVRSWLLPRIGTLRPDGPDAGFRHKIKFRWLVKGDGLEVTDITPGSPADRAGLRTGDRIRRIDGEEGTTEMDERVWTWRLERAGTRVMLEVERDKQRRTVEVKLVAPRR